jgi:hypothetical protein
MGKKGRAEDKSKPRVELAGDLKGVCLAQSSVFVGLRTALRALACAAMVCCGSSGQQLPGGFYFKYFQAKFKSQASLYFAAVHSSSPRSLSFASLANHPETASAASEEWSLLFCWTMRLTR